MFIFLCAIFRCLKSGILEISKRMMRNLERDIRKKTISVLGRCCLNPVVDRFLCFYILFFSHFFSQLPLPYKIGFRHCPHSEGGERFRCQKFQFRLRIFLLLNISGIFRRILAFQKPRRCRDKKSRTFSEKRGSFFQKRGRFSEKCRRFFLDSQTFLSTLSLTLDIKHQKGRVFS